MTAKDKREECGRISGVRFSNALPAGQKTDTKLNRVKSRDANHVACANLCTSTRKRLLGSQD
jgi:hypothetical protein